MYFMAFALACPARYSYFISILPVCGACILECEDEWQHRQLPLSLFR